MTIAIEIKRDELIATAKPCPRGINADVYANQVRKEAWRLANGGKVDKTAASIFNLTITHNYSPIVEANRCARCGGAGVGDWGSVRGGKCYKCGGTGKNS